MIAKNQRLFIILGTASALLFIPLMAMQFTTEVNWTVSDFVVAGILLFGTGLLIEVAFRKVKKLNVRWFVILGILVVLFLVWAELAVGVFGTPFAGN